MPPKQPKGKAKAKAKNKTTKPVAEPEAAPKRGSQKPKVDYEYQAAALSNLEQLRRQAREASQRSEDDEDEDEEGSDAERPEPTTTTPQKEKKAVPNAILWPDGTKLTHKEGSRMSIKRADSKFYSSSYTCLDKMPDHHFRDWLEKISPACTRVKLERCNRQQMFSLLHLAVGVLPSDKLPSLLDLY